MTCTTTDDVTFNYVVGDNLPALSFTYKDKDGNAIDITGFSFALHIDFQAGVTTVVGSIVDAASGTFQFVFGDSDLSESGIFNIEVQITNASSQKLTIQGMKFDIAPELA